MGGSHLQTETAPQDQSAEGGQSSSGEGLPYVQEVAASDQGVQSLWGVQLKVDQGVQLEVEQEGLSSLDEGLAFDRGVPPLMVVVRASWTWGVQTEVAVPVQKVGRPLMGAGQPWMGVVHWKAGSDQGVQSSLMWGVYLMVGGQPSGVRPLRGVVQRKVVVPGQGVLKEAR